ncbi:unnamed protein product [Thelazia callipaeda]|uniref:Ras-GAP domain-containing protein n=1 Tax=Thelazia callipaeda TaxID=103827 RepID=A0A0N5CK39_THECL|nr:unnamed protein product [Thelazia callipaeda]
MSKNCMQSSSWWSRPFCLLRFDRNYFKFQSIFGTYYRYTVTATSDGAKLSSAVKDKSSGEVAAIRIKARYQSVQILPMQAYSDLLAFIKKHYLSLCCALEPTLSVKAKEDLATALVRIMHKLRMAKHFLCDLIMSEVDVLDNEHLMFRGNSLATKAMEAYMKLVADDYLQSTLGDFVKAMQQSEKDCEVDPLKLPNINPIALERNRHQLVINVEAAWAKITNRLEIFIMDVFPFELREIFNSLRRRLEEIGRLDLADTLISSSIFLRFLCPAILSPSLFNLVSEYPSGNAARNLTLIAKTLQTLANFTKFGGKEHYMDFMNDFVEREWDNMHKFLMKISSMPINSDVNSGENGWNISVDIGKEVSLLYSYLDELWTQEIYEQACKYDPQTAELRLILTKLRHIQMKNDVYGDSESLTFESAPSDYDNTNILRQLLKTQAFHSRLNSYNNTTKFPPHIRNTVSESHVMKKATAATHLNTSDDYVLDIALLKDSLAVRQAGLTVQKHRNGHYRNQRYFNDSTSCERQNKRNAYTALAAIPSNQERIIAFDTAPNGDNDSISQYDTSIPSNISSYSNCTTARIDHHNEDTDSDETTRITSATRLRHTRPPRKSKRRTASSTDRQQVITSCQDPIVAPSSSGYQSQNHSSSLSSSNSSSPVERTATQINHPVFHAALQTSNPTFNAHECIPSTSSSSGNFEKIPLNHNERYYVRSAPSTMLKEHLYGSFLKSPPLDKTNGGLYEIPMCSLPRTNPHCSSRNSMTTATGGISVLKSFVDISNDGSVPHSASTRCSDEDDNIIKECSIKWCFTSEQQPNNKKDWSRNGKFAFSQQEIIEQQKREIRRLMKENEELKRCVAAQKQITNNGRNTNSPMIIVDSHASEESCDSLSSSNELQISSNNNKAITHC